ncbi:Uncharacterised protein [Mycobacteroides abscessus subsp. abscessus]|nr:Uncharacterised protein [Mycobacteroides abscessus subsp. abscessus]
MSRASGASEAPSPPMWCMAAASTHSSPPRSNRRTRKGGWVVTSNTLARNARTASATSSRSDNRITTGML